MFTFSEDIRQPLILKYDNKQVTISKHIAAKLQNPDLIAINFMHQSYCNKFAGCILNEEDGFATQLQVSVFLNFLKQVLPLKPQIIILVLTPGYLIEKWKNQLENIGEYNVKIVASTACPADIDQENHVVLLSFEDIKLVESFTNYHFSSVIIDHFDIVANKLVIKKVEGDFNIGITRRNFYINPDQKLQWTMLNWANPTSVGRLIDYYEIDNDNFANLRDNYFHWWLTLTWDYCESFKRNLEEEDESQPPQLIKTKRTYKKRKQKICSNVPENEITNSELKVEEKVVSGSEEEKAKAIYSTNEPDKETVGIKLKIQENVIKSSDEEKSTAINSTSEIFEDSNDTQINKEPNSQDSIEYIPDLDSFKTEHLDKDNILLNIIEGTSSKELDHESRVNLKKEELYSQIFSNDPIPNANTNNSSEEYLLSLI